MRVALDTSIFVAFYLPEDKLHLSAKNLIDRIISREISYACISKIILAEIGYILERITQDKEYVSNCLYSTMLHLSLDVIDLTWDFIVNLAHLKAVNPISFCDNATLTAAKLTSSDEIFKKEKEIIDRKKSKIQGAKIIFLEDLQTDKLNQNSSQIEKNLKSE